MYVVSVWIDKGQKWTKIFLLVAVVLTTANRSICHKNMQIVMAWSLGQQEPEKRLPYRSWRRILCRKCSCFHGGCEKWFGGACTIWARWCKITWCLLIKRKNNWVHRIFLLRSTGCFLGYLWQIRPSRTHHSCGNGTFVIFTFAGSNRGPGGGD